MNADEAELRRQLTMAQANNHQRNRELDALHYVWCDGGCPGGVHRWQENPLTAEVIDAAIRNTNRLIKWWLNSISRLDMAAGEANTEVALSKRWPRYNAEKARLLSVYRLAQFETEGE